MLLLLVMLLLLLLVSGAADAGQRSEGRRNGVQALASPRAFFAAAPGGRCGAPVCRGCEGATTI